jgi:hypothetical protein
MNKKFFIAWLVVFVVWMLGSFVVHGLLLQADYAKLPNLFRPEAESQKYFPLMILAHVIMSGALVWIYARGAEAKPWMAQGVRFGVVIALLTVVPTYMIYYVVQPMPGMHVAKQIIFDGILMVLLGVVVAFLYRSKPSA